MQLLSPVPGSLSYRRNGRIQCAGWHVGKVDGQAPRNNLQHEEGLVEGLVTVGGLDVCRNSK